MAQLKAPFPYFGGKSRIAGVVWSYLGDPPNYVEPFFGSGAVLLARPGAGNARRTETVNDLSALLVNFWRALRADPAGVAHYADYPVSELDLHARHRWLVDQVDVRERVRADPDFYDLKVAGYWVWGACAWIGSGWCPEEDAGRGLSEKLPHLGDAGRGINRRLPEQLPHLGGGGRGINRRLPEQRSPSACATCASPAATGSAC